MRKKCANMHDASKSPNTVQCCRPPIAGYRLWCNGAPFSQRLEEVRKRGESAFANLVGRVCASMEILAVSGMAASLRACPYSRARIAAGVVRATGLIHQCRARSARHAPPSCCAKAPPMRRILPVPRMSKTTSTFPSENRAGRASEGLDASASSSIARKIFGANIATQSRSQRKVPRIEMPTSDMTFQRNSSFGKGSRWIRALSCGKAPHAQTAQPATQAKTERKSGWFSEMPFIQGRPL
eukprot:scaffold288964_cov27-Tisochrysis_lutea.AAC.3